MDRADAEARNATSQPHPRDACLIELFERWVAAAPDASALVEGRQQLSYAQLDGRAGALCASLIDRGVAPGDRVGVLGGRSSAAIAAILGILKAGAVYVPLDADYPAARLATMVADAGLDLIVRMPDAVALDGDTPTLDLDDDALAGPPATSRRVGPRDLAFIMFTSGSTGRPKAVGTRQRNVVRLVVDTDYLVVAPGDRVLHVASLSFDASTLEIWSALLNGGCLVIADSHVLLSPHDLRVLLRRERVAVAVVTTAAFHQLARRQPDLFRALDTLIVGGEALSLELARDVLASGPPRNFINGYGPTENTTVTTVYRVNDLDAAATRMPIGAPITDTTVYILRDDGAPADVGEVGELVTGGDGVTAGYLNDAELTAERFIADPFSDDPAARLYRTGDLAAWRADGMIDYHGRRDTQIKIHGYRIEPTEVEAALRAQPAIADAVVVRRETDDAERDAELVAYVVGAADRPLPTSRELRRRLGDTLPPHAIPARFVALDDLPLGANGKADRAALATRGPIAETGTALPADRAAIHERVKAIWLETVGDPDLVDVAPHETFFDIGGTSFDVLVVHTRVTQAFDAPGLTQLALFTSPTLAGYSDRVLSMLARGVAR